MIKELLLLLYFIILVYAFANTKCGGKRYKCGEENQNNVCVNVSEYRGKVHELTPCSDDKICLWQDAVFQKPVYCTDKPTKDKILPGEGCSGDSDCLSNSCKSGVCLGLKLNQQCAGHQYCDVGYYCDTYCKQQVQFEQSCQNDYQCTNNCVCNLGKCAYYYSLENNIKADNPKACYYGYINPNNGTCQNGPHSLTKSKPCETDTDCILLDSDQKLYGYSECQCGFNAGGFSYCSLAEGDPEYLKILELFQWLLQVNQYCHTILRYGPCSSLYLDEYIDYQKAVKFYELQSQIMFNDECIQKIYTDEYWGIHSNRLYILLIILLLLQ
ncbi:unnamed protein product [Paramecium primaurelia]|uniref:Dickkopf N-terminal cysteine-rich domain-containing protein n=1 Tax=Paramecium primaurelia TaxID=5886 RepID=A0A8S1NJ41_PARPR|nr:unnamed protein product [Paramecium primaurelia]